MWIGKVAGQHAYFQKSDGLRKRKSVKTTGLWSEESDEMDSGLDRSQCFETAVSRTLGWKLGWSGLFTAMFWDRQWHKSVRPFLSIEIQFQAVCLRFTTPTKTTELNGKKNRTKVRAQNKCVGWVIIIIIIIIIIINCNWVVTRWQWLFYMYTKYEIGY